LRGRSYEGLPPEVGAFNSQFWPHAPWPVHNFGDFGHFYAIFGSRGVGVIPGGFEEVEAGGGRSMIDAILSRGW